MLSRTGCSIPWTMNRLIHLLTLPATPIIPTVRRSTKTVLPLSQQRQTAPVSNAYGDHYGQSRFTRTPLEAPAPCSMNRTPRRSATSPRDAAEQRIEPDRLKRTAAQSPGRTSGRCLAIPFLRPGDVPKTIPRAMLIWMASGACIGRHWISPGRAGNPIRR